MLVLLMHYQHSLHALMQTNSLSLGNGTCYYEAKCEYIVACCNFENYIKNSSDIYALPNSEYAFIIINNGAILLLLLLLRPLLPFVFNILPVVLRCCWWSCETTIKHGHTEFHQNKFQTILNTLNHQFNRWIASYTAVGRRWNAYK